IVLIWLQGIQAESKCVRQMCPSAAPCVTSFALKQKRAESLLAPILTRGRLCRNKQSPSLYQRPNHHGEGLSFPATRPPSPHIPAREYAPAIPDCVPPLSSG
ncbi:unnamed protein product, partial [Ectocarpus sp. 8 AP-2014]